MPHDKQRKRRNILSKHIKNGNSGRFMVKNGLIQQDDVVSFVQKHGSRFGISKLTRIEIAIVLNLEVEFLRMHGYALPLIGNEPAFADDGWGEEELF